MELSGNSFGLSNHYEDCSLCFSRMVASRDVVTYSCFSTASEVHLCLQYLVSCKGFITFLTDLRKVGVDTAKRRLAEADLQT